MTPPLFPRSNTFLMLIYFKIRSTHVYCKQILFTVAYYISYFHQKYFVNVNADKLNMHRLFFFNEKSCYCLLSLPALYCFGEGNFHTLGMPDVIWFRTKCSFIIHNIFKIKLQSLWEELYLLCPLSLPGRVCSIHGMSICQQYHDLGGIFPV